MHWRGGGLTFTRVFKDGTLETESTNGSLGDVCLDDCVEVRVGGRVFDLRDESNVDVGFIFCRVNQDGTAFAPPTEDL